MAMSATGPDLVIAGAARCGTSLLAARLSTHPAIDAPAVKEPNYFSRHLDQGPDWYDAFYAARSPGNLRLDASVSYTYPQHPGALAALAAAAPDAQVVYVVREPVQRAVSHYLFYRHYFESESAETFGQALAARDYYVQVSDYTHWLAELTRHFGPDRLLVVPFDALTRSDADVARVVCSRVGLSPPPEGDREVTLHRNQTVSFRSDRVRRATRTLRHSSAYPRLRRLLGPTLMRRVRGAVTTRPALPTVDEALATCSPEQLTALDALRVDAMASVDDWLKDQDERLGLSWRDDWTR